MSVTPDPGLAVELDPWLAMPLTPVGVGIHPRCRVTIPAFRPYTGFSPARRLRFRITPFAVDVHGPKHLMAGLLWSLWSDADGRVPTALGRGGVLLSRRSIFGGFRGAVVYPTPEGTQFLSLAF
jgi:hypothetical protein